jgi:hypothetical protein
VPAKKGGRNEARGIIAAQAGANRQNREAGRAGKPADKGILNSRFSVFDSSPRLRFRLGDEGTGFRYAPCLGGATAAVADFAATPAGAATFAAGAGTAGGAAGGANTGACEEPMVD